MSDYQPIACMDHERLEFAVLRRQALALQLTDGSHLCGTPLDVYTREGAEWLRFQIEGGSEQVLRLDQIARFTQIA